MDVATYRWRAEGRNEMVLFSIKCWFSSFFYWDDRDIIKHRPNPEFQEIIFKGLSVSLWYIFLRVWTGSNSMSWTPQMWGAGWRKYSLEFSTCGWKEITPSPWTRTFPKFWCEILNAIVDHHPQGHVQIWSLMIMEKSCTIVNCCRFVTPKENMLVKFLRFWEWKPMTNTVNFTEINVRTEDFHSSVETGDDARKSKFY